MTDGVAELATLRPVSTAWRDAVDRVDPSAVGDPTPCDEWTVADLLDHVTGGNRFTVSILGGAAAGEALDATVQSFGPDHDPVREAVDSQRRMADAFGEPGALCRPCDHVAGPLSGLDVLRARLHDLIIHTWDLDQATGAGTPIDPDLVAWAVRELGAPDSSTARWLGPHLGSPSSASDLLRAFERSERWRDERAAPRTG